MRKFISGKMLVATKESEKRRKRQQCQATLPDIAEE
jgi:hypothetical protein